MEDDDILASVVEDDELLAQFKDWNKELDHWGQWKKEADEAFRFVAGHQWPKEDEAAMEDNNRVPMVINLTGPMVDAVVGAEINGRSEVKYLPRGIEDGGLSELLSRGAEWVRDECDGEMEESQAYRDAFICGLGAIEGRMEYEDEPGGKIIFERIEACEALPDPSASKPNAIDARYLRRRRNYSKREFRERFPNAEPMGREQERTEVHIDDPRNRYDEPVSDTKKNEVTVDHWQWYDLETVYTVQNPMSGEQIEIGGEEIESALNDLREAAEAEGVPFDMEPPSYKRRVYRYAFVAGSQILDQGESEEFSIKFVTGLRDRDKKCWYGIVRRMMDPQRTVNKLYSLGLHILAVNAKGGILAEKSAIEGQKNFEQEWARADSVVTVADGALSRGAILPKTAPPFPQALMPLFEMAIRMLREAAGINEEMLGQVDREQPGVIEAQRKQAAYGILASFFDAFRRYRKLQGRQLLRLMRFLPDGTLIRIVDDEGVHQFAPIAFNEDVTKFDVIVDETPSGPNHKERVWMSVQQLVPYLMQAQLPMSVWGELLRYSPLPESATQKIIAGLSEDQGDPQMAAMQQQLEQIMQQLGIEDAQATIAEKQANVQLKNVEAFSKEVEAVNLMQNPDPNPRSIL
jgi:hypothetical protein